MKNKNKEREIIEKGLKKMASRNILELFANFIIENKDFKVRLDMSKRDMFNDLFDLKNIEKNLIELITETYIINENSAKTFKFDVVYFFLKVIKGENNGK